MAVSRSAAVVVVVAAITAACNQAPTAPSPPVATPPPVQAAPPPPAANLAVRGTLDFISCENGLCSFSATVRNIGDACAANISGETFVTSAQGQEVGRARWSLPASTVIPPGQEVPYSGVGMPQAVLNHLDGRYSAQFFFDSRPC
jgi:hypothetical protein